MPGLVVSISVKVQEVKAGEELCVVEAMKMENILRAEREGVIGKLHAAVGDSLAVDAVQGSRTPAARLRRSPSARCHRTGFGSRVRRRREAPRRLACALRLPFARH